MHLLKHWSVQFVLISLLIRVSLEVPKPIRCLPCTNERLGHCPPMENSCGGELVREPGCGCCQTCALASGQPCGVYSARCSAGLLCYPQIEEGKPLQALTQGRAICMEQAEVERIQALQTEQAEAQESNLETETPTPAGTDHAPDRPAGTNLRPIPAPDKSYDIQNSPDTEFERRSKRINQKPREPQVQGACQAEMQRAIARITLVQQRGNEELYRFHIPNCDKRGLYNLKQCESSLDGQRGICWCVFHWNGKRIPNSPEVRGDPQCHRYVPSGQQK
ncbi:insulin-like growth factor-binding protein 1 [Callorhinchus milii]|uniref:Insulin-like growth factor-binding protein 1 n=1 Tax=Callorhinchus milii TaxID=7868 RepID=V9KPS1_CALMI|nr:insulin-like growth factor-binding protein 1 [Callorhinchus milii]|eukprot:gi/632983813/ref/XP_007908832.1/ PREDICTED: insulin-like growth factor-binding protein 1 [Callorhinchus milii]